MPDTSDIRRNTVSISAFIFNLFPLHLNTPLVGNFSNSHDARDTRDNNCVRSRPGFLKLPERNVVVLTCETGTTVTETEVVYVTACVIVISRLRALNFSHLYTWSSLGWPRSSKHRVSCQMKRIRSIGATFLVRVLLNGQTRDVRGVGRCFLCPEIFLSIAFASNAKFIQGVSPLT